MTTRYEETQRFRQPWLWAVVVGTAGLVWYGAWRQLVRGEPFGTNPAPDGVLVGIVALTGIGLPALMGAARLRTEVRNDGLYLRFSPFHLHAHRWRYDEIDEAYARDYSPLREYGGWGLRYGPSGWAYNVSGRRGVQLVLRSGKRVLIGSQHAEALAAAIQARMAE